jgi:hypothetical protein
MTSKHSAAVEAMFQQIKPLIENNDMDVVLHTLMIVLSMCGNQSGIPSEHFKAFVVQELDRLMLVEGKTEGQA